MKHTSDKNNKKEILSQKNKTSFPEQKRKESNKAGTPNKTKHAVEEKGSMKNSK